MKLYNYFRSSASYRVRIALALKGLSYDYLPIHLVKGEQRGSHYAAMTPAQLVPTLVVDDERPLTQSLAIVEYLDEVQPEPPLLPADALGRARVRSLALDIACEIHPVNNLRVLRHLTEELRVSEDDKLRWYRHWTESGLAAFEQRLVNDALPGRFCHGDTPTLADLTLVPQIFNARRFDCQLGELTRTLAVFDECMKLDAFASTQPSNCPDAS